MIATHTPEPEPAAAPVPAASVASAAFSESSAAFGSSNAPASSSPSEAIEVIGIPVKVKTSIVKYVVILFIRSIVNFLYFHEPEGLIQFSFLSKSA